MERPMRMDGEIARLAVPAKPGSLSCIAALVRELARAEGLAAREVDHLAAAVDEACTSSIELGFDPGEDGALDVVFGRRPGLLVASVEDRGLPFDAAALERGERSGLGFLLMKSFADEVRFTNLGPRGKRVELLFRLPSTFVEDHIRELDRDLLPQGIHPDAARAKVRLLRADEGVALARCVYRTYGRSYPGEDLYYPERVRELVETGQMKAFVAATEEGEILGAAAVFRDRPDAEVAWTEEAMVDPRYLGEGPFERMGVLVDLHVRQSGLRGLFRKALASHPSSQEVCKASGASEAGVLLGALPEVSSRGEASTGKAASGRRTAFLYYKRYRDEGGRPVFAPDNHRAMIRRIYEGLGLARALTDPGQGGRRESLPPLSFLVTEARPPIGHARIGIKSVGRDLEDEVRPRLREFCEGRFDCIYADLPLCDPGTAAACATLEELGFSFGAVLPEVDPEGDVLRLQYLNNVVLDPSGVQIRSGFGRCLFEYVANESRRGA